MAEKELTFKDVADHNTKKDLWLVIHDKVYDISKFVDEHPGGEEVLLDVAGQDASEDFEDVGHSDEAREILAPLFVGNLKRLPGDPVPKSTANKSGSGLTQGDRTSAGLGLYAIIVVVAAIAYGVYQWHLKQQASA